MRLLDCYTVLLLDMNGTFMFWEDSFSPGSDFYATYRTLGGKTLTPADVNRAIWDCYHGMMRDYRDPAKYDDFLQVREGLLHYARVPADREGELTLLERVFAHHELGRIPPDYAALLRRLSQTHRLGVVSNLWAAKDLWLLEFERMGIADVFTTTVFSSDYRSIKPSPVLYQEALAAFGVDRSQVLFVGDSLTYDVQGAKAVGLASAWINATHYATGEPHPLADYVIPDLLHLESMVSPNRSLTDT